MKHVGNFIAMMVGGLIVLVVGIVIAAVSIPSVTDFGQPSGSTGGMLIGVLIAGVGQMIFLIGTIALGVFLGTRAAHDERDSVGV